MRINTFAKTGLLAALLFSYEAHAQLTRPNAPIVVELFTSQSCSSCPAADAYLRTLAARPNVIVLACHVTYWNHLSWEDTLSKEFCTARQKQYSTSGDRGGRIFTPELIVNGYHSVVGNNSAAVEQALADGSGYVLPIRITRVMSDTLEIELPQGKMPAEGAVLHLISYGREQTVHMRSGENEGRTVAYTNPVQHIQTRVFDWKGSQKMMMKLDSQHQNAAGYVALLQDGNYGVGRVLAAGRL